ncbi:hypothetical protein JJD41_19190 [Oxynema sp. CENA135]|uniref:RuBisCO accumulation factor 1 n=1 Tax=Oxynema sp. CENA135 TaxID=984206 RepID=UPI00190C4C09|nr:RuBisCO accumulation factor 1 [Oxynema sp. CENA135]MBK4731978.1 hypothetical protein [Oxynema sp. CENA135]
MTNTPPEQPTAEIAPDPLFQALRRKEGTWVEWARHCQTLQKAGYSPQQIFEETGFEPIQQNQIIVGAQVYASIVAGGAADATQAYFQQKASDILYELRILTQDDRAAAADFILKHQFNADEAHEIAKALKEYSRFSEFPDGFSPGPGEAIAYQCWKHARQKSDLQERSRLIAKGLNYAETEGARQKLQDLLTDFTVVKSRSAPRLPLFRLESSDELPRTIPVVGEFPLTAEDLKAVPILEEIGPFGIVKSSGNAAWVSIPGWQVILKAEDPVAIACASDRLPNPLPGKVERTLAIVDRRQRQWRDDAYFLIEQNGQLELQWFETQPETRLLGQLILVLRPKRILDEVFTAEPWQIDE